MSYGMKSYNIVDNEEKQPVKWPRRVEILFEEYKNAAKSIGKNINLTYQTETVDLLEKTFMDRVALRPESLKTTINAIYRVKNLRSNEEWYFYNASKTCNTALNEPATPFSYQGYGWHKRPICGFRWNEMKQTKEVDVVAYEHGFENKWNKDEVKKMLDSSFLPCEFFYVGNVGGNANDPIETPYYQIQNLQDFLEGTFEDLYDMGRLGISYKEQSSLYMVDAARKKEKENRERALGMRQPQNKHIT